MRLYAIKTKQDGELVKMVGGGGDIIILAPYPQSYETIFCTDDKYLVETLLTESTLKHYGIRWEWDFPCNECVIVELEERDDNSRDKRQEAVR